ncbi:hypothetical protein ElyMa_002818200 [Elysia marginata]|uniref:Uncharacterized protein n=1 Tax=Elysia marginata TaxID=1093978 RepID=A0AAV4HVK7_9GAST|nr:hypothetical protein ElyMa_002818200 [Elysia marginata]
MSLWAKSPGRIPPPLNDQQTSTLNPGVLQVNDTSTQTRPGSQTNHEDRTRFKMNFESLTGERERRGGDEEGSGEGGGGGEAYWSSVYEPSSFFSLGQ